MKRALALREGLDGWMSRATEALGARSGREPGWTERLRHEALAAFEGLGFPSVNDEEWRYTNVAPIARTPFVLPAGSLSLRHRTDALPLDSRLGPFGFAGKNRLELVFLNGRLVPDWCVTGGLPAGVTFGSLADSLASGPALLERALSGETASRAFVALNAALWNDGLFLHVPSGVILPSPVQVFHLTVPEEKGRAFMVHPRTVILLEENSQASAVETFLGCEADSFTNSVTSIFLAGGAVLDYARVQNEGRQTSHVGNVLVRQERDSRLTTHLVSLGARLARNEAAVLLDGEGAGVTMNGLFCASDSQHVDNHTLIDHIRPRTCSQEYYKGILDDGARGAFDGRIVVHKTAPRADARQRNRNLILSGTALVDSKPQLEINNNDVKATHGSTTGRLDPDAFFYLRSRGLDPRSARSLLTLAFASEIVERIADGDLFACLQAWLLSWLPRHEGPRELS